MKKYLLFLALLSSNYFVKGMNMSEIKNEVKLKGSAVLIWNGKNGEDYYRMGPDDERTLKYENKSNERSFLWKLFWAIQDFGLFVFLSEKDTYFSGQGYYGQVVEPNIFQIGDYQKGIIQETDRDEFIRATKSFLFLEAHKANVIIFKLIEGKIIVEGYTLEGNLIAL